ncbi:CehA/McbA family metallohydrolase [Paenibacillus sp. B01]|uniref:CehA/McbA family metallohydrolase n=1 Tax=Paenibacillus sp. B01 TaxID=2660554 RepID=UPI00129B7C27|nr:CehA/McbA family metallohydrolase [Paenibacillus sp. B01]QGG57021.1 phosphoesterase [Paenibacillus sp. B01]
MNGNSLPDDGLRYDADRLENGPDAEHPGVQTLRLTRRISAEERRTYPELAFDVEEDLERIEVLYEYDRQGGEAVIDIGLRSPERIVGWSGGARSRFFVAAEQATPGYRSGKPGRGRWAVMLGAYRIPEGGVTVSVEVRLRRPVSRWVKGDLHAHTTHSDGAYSLAEASSSAASRGLDFLALTDHNTSSQNAFADRADERLLLLPGVELTSYGGHANLLGHPDALDDFRVASPQEAERQLSLARERGAFVSLNHPFCPDCPWEFGFDLPFDAIEVWNGPWRELNEQALSWWQRQLSLGRRIVALGGSDTHRPDRYVRHGRPAASLWTRSPGTAGLMQALRAGRVVLSHDPEDTFLTLRSGSAGVGDEAAPHPDGSLPLTIGIHAAADDEIFLWSDRGLEAAWRLAGRAAPSPEAAAMAAAYASLAGPGGLPEGEGSSRAQPDVPATDVRTDREGRATLSFAGSGDRQFYRLESRRRLPASSRTFVTCLTNPVYVKR